MIPIGRPIPYSEILHLSISSIWLSVEITFFNKVFWSFSNQLCLLVIALYTEDLLVYGKSIHFLSMYLTLLADPCLNNGAEDELLSSF